MDVVASFSSGSLGVGKCVPVICLEAVRLIWILHTLEHSCVFKTKEVAPIYYRQGWESRTLAGYKAVNCKFLIQPSLLFTATETPPIKKSFHAYRHKPFLYMYACQAAAKHSLTCLCKRVKGDSQSARTASAELWTVVPNKQQSGAPIQSGPNPICLAQDCKLLCALSLQIAVNHSRLASCIA